MNNRAFDNSKNTLIEKAVQIKKNKNNNSKSIVQGSRNRQNETEKRFRISNQI